MAVRGAAWPTVADAAHDGGALKRLEVAVGEVQGGIAFDDGDLGVAEETGELEIALDKRELGGGAERKGELDAWREAGRCIDFELQAGVRARAGEGETADNLGGESAGRERFVEFDGEVGRGIRRWDDMDVGATDGDVRGGLGNVRVCSCWNGTGGGEVQGRVGVAGERLEDWRLPGLRVVVIVVLAAVGGGVVNVDERRVRVGRKRKEKTEHRKREDAKGAGQHERLLGRT